MSRDNNVSKGLLIGFLSGAVVGAAVALLYAPKSGKEFRQDIKDKTQDLMEGAEDFAKVAKEKAIATYNEGRQKAEQLVTDAKEKADIILKDASRVLTDAKTKASEEASNIKAGFNAGIDAYKEAKKS